MAAVADIMGGRVHGTIEGVFGLIGPLQSGDLKLVGQMAPARMPEYPNVPTVAETLPGLTAIGFMSLAAPAATPEPIQRRLAEGLRQALDSPAVKKRYEELGVPIRNMTPAETKAFIENEQKIWWPLVKELTPQ
jgi:tripartite-type tricarboxylate transporter receptor subunit TctC